jgi:hypothetical protein
MVKGCHSKYEMEGQFKNKYCPSLYFSAKTPVVANSKEMTSGAMYVTETIVAACLLL